MTLFVYTAMNNEGQNVSGELDAPAPTDVVTRLKRDGLYALTVQKAQDAGRNAAGRSRKKSLTGRLFPGISGKDVTALTRQMTTFLQGGFPLVRALEFIQKNAMKDSIADLMGEVADAVRSGGTLTEALQKHPKTFDRLYINMVSAGEVSGQLETMYERLAAMRESSEELRGEIKGALTYPGFMMLAMGGSLAILMAFVVPKFAAMFEDMGSALPTPTVILMQVADAFQNYWWAGLGLIAAAYFGLVQYRKTDEGRLRIDQVILNIPILGDLALKSSTARFSQTLSTLLNSGVDLVSALACVQNVTGNEVLGRAVESSLEAVKEGKNLSDTLQGSAFPEELVEMIRVGEESGQVAPMLERAASTYSREVGTVVKSFTKILEPLMILVMGVVIGLIVVAMLLPVFEMSSGG